MPASFTVENLRQLSERLISANATGGQIASIDLRPLNRVIEYAPDDMTVTVEAGITLQSLQTQLASRGQWLPIDPPQPATATIGEILAANASGPRRLGYGTVRDWLIGMRVMLANGTLVKSGAKVVKNVAGYDLAKLFIGSRGTLGVIVEATFKLRPLPEREAFLQRSFVELQDAVQAIEAVIGSSLNPVVLDLHNLAPDRGEGANTFTVVAGLAGAREDVESESKQAADLGLEEQTDLSYEMLFWSGQFAGPTQQRSVLPSQLSEAVRKLGDVPFVARAGNGVVFYRGAAPPPSPDLPWPLLRRVKDAFDPKHVFPELIA